MKMRRLLSVLLLICLVVTLLPMGAVKVNAEIVTSQYGDITFTTFEDLKTICSKTYAEDDYIYAWYEGSEELVIKENLSIPENLQIYFWNKTVKVPTGVTLTVAENTYLSVDNLVVEGTVNAWSMSVSQRLTLSGKLSVSNYISLGETVSEYEAEKVTLNMGADLSWLYEFNSFEELKAIVQKAAKGNDNGWYYEAELFTELYGSDLTINEDLVIPPNCSIFLGNYTKNLTVAKGCTLENNGAVSSCIPIVVEGTLCNYGGFAVINSADGNNKGMLTITDTGKYTGDGILFVDSETASDPGEMLVGMDLSGFEVYEYGDDSYRYWELYPAKGEQPEQPGEVTGFIARQAGNTRYDTALMAADLLKDIWGVDKFENIIVSSGEDFADALAGSYLAAVKGAPILLVKDSTVKKVKEYIQQNLVPGGTVYLLGGKAAVPEKMETGLDGFNVKRLGGNTRYETNLLILQEAGVEGRDIIVCTGKSFADSLSASAVGLPILLVKDGLTAAQKDFLEGSSGNYYIIGGKNAVSETVEKQLNDYGKTHRIAGDTRYKTSVMVAEYFTGSNEFAVLAYGENFPDGLAGGPLAYALGAPLLLTKPGREADAAEFLASRGITNGIVMGGTAVLPDKTVSKVFGAS